MLIGKLAIIILVAATMAAPRIANAGSTSGQCGLLKVDAAKVRADNEIIQAAGGISDSESCASARDMVRTNDDMISIITRDPEKCRVTDDHLEALETSRTRMAARAASCNAKVGSASSQCASLKSDWRAIHDNIEVMHEETTMRFAYSGWCGNARNLIRAADHILSIATHDPSRCRQASDNLDRLEVWKNKLALHTEGCP